MNALAKINALKEKARAIAETPAFKPDRMLQLLTVEYTTASRSGDDAAKEDVRMKIQVEVDEYLNCVDAMTSVIKELAALKANGFRA